MEAGTHRRAFNVSGSIVGRTVLLALLLLVASRPSVVALIGFCTASSSAAGTRADGAVDGDRFSTNKSGLWRGEAGAGEWWWQVKLDRPHDIAAIGQVMGDHPFVLRNAPRDYRWQASVDGMEWTELKETITRDEKRTYRVHRLRRPESAQFLRLQITAAHGPAPVLREVEILEDFDDPVHFPPWIIVVNTTHEPTLPGHGQEFIPLVRSCPGWEKTQAQQIWLKDFDESFVAAEPRPLCAFLSGNFKDWCEVDRTAWRGTQEVLRQRNLPIWASCGGAQGLALLSEYGVEKPWDCPHCRDPKNPKTPLYTHIGHTAARPCGDYTGCIHERGPHRIRQAMDDPVFRGLPPEFVAMESHCGQVERAPKNWLLIAIGGEGTKTAVQCLRLKDRYVYAAQFHIEMAGTEVFSRQLMGNFLSLARDWGGYNPKGKKVATPKVLIPNR